MPQCSPLCPGFPTAHLFDAEHVTGWPDHQSERRGEVAAARAHIEDPGSRDQVVVEHLQAGAVHVGSADSLPMPYRKGAVIIPSKQQRDQLCKTPSSEREFTCMVSPTRALSSSHTFMLAERACLTRERGRRDCG
jgi:hypothetical protein